ncbi:hypothetical protein MTO96_042316, partial [Rhipicephalus appendiculatus]
SEDKTSKRTVLGSVEPQLTFEECESGRPCDSDYAFELRDVVRPNDHWAIHKFSNYDGIAYVSASLSRELDILRIEKTVLMNYGTDRSGVICRTYVLKTLVSETVAYNLDDAKQVLDRAESLHPCRGAGASSDFTYKNLTKKLEQQITHSDGLVFSVKCKGAVNQQGKWSQIVGVFATKGNVKGDILLKILMEATILVEQAGLFVDHITCDGAPWNRKMWKLAGVSASSKDINSTIQHPVDDKRKLHFISDFPHLLKCLRNGLLQKGFATPEGLVSVRPVREAYLRDSSVRTLKVMPNLTETHLEPNSFEKMRTTFAFQLFGPYVLRGLAFYKEEIEKKCGSIEATQVFFSRINRLIAVMTSRFRAEALRPTSSDAAFLSEFLEYLNDWEACNDDKRHFLSECTATGFRVTIANTLSLLKYLTESVGFKYMMTSRLSTDPVEHFFGIVRQSSGCNAHPSPDEFLITVNCLSFYNLAHSVDSANANPDMINALVTVHDRKGLKAAHRKIDELLSQGKLDEAESTIASMPAKLADHIDVSFFSFPKDADWKKRWIIAIKRDEGPFFTVTKFTKVCSRHFTEDNYLPNVAGNRRFLKQDAVPSIFAFSAPRPPPRKKPRNREPRNLVTATAPSEDERSTTADVSDVDICSPSTSVTNSIDDVVCGCACSLKISDLTEQLDVVTARVRALESEVKKKTEEVELFKSSFYKAERALEIAAQERSQLEKRLSRKFSVQWFRDSPDDINFYTGLPDYKAFMELFELLDPGENCENIKAWSRNYADCHTNAGRPHLLPAREQLFLVLVRLRLGLFEKDLAYRFQISLPTVSRLCTTWISFMYLQIGIFQYTSYNRRHRDQVRGA